MDEPSKQHTWVSIATLALCFIGAVQAAPPRTFKPKIWDNIEMTIYHSNTNHVAGVDSEISDAETRLWEWFAPDDPSWAHEGFGAYNEEEDIDPVAFDWRIGSRTIYIRHPEGQPPRYYERLAAGYGMLLWLREWRDVGWVPDATFTLVWTDEKLPDGSSTSDGFFGEVLQGGVNETRVGLNGSIDGVAEAISTTNTSQRNLSTTPASSLRYVSRLKASKPIPTNSSTLTVPRTDNWEHIIEHDGGENRMTAIKFGGRYIHLFSMYDLLLDCLMTNALSREFLPSNDPDDEVTEGSPATQQPMTCGAPGGPQIYMDGKSQPDLRFPFIMWMQLKDLFEIMMLILNAEVDNEQHWVPSLAQFRSEYWGDSDDNPEVKNLDALMVGWWGYPPQVQEEKDTSLASSTNATNATNTGGAKAFAGQVTAATW